MSRDPREITGWLLDLYADPNGELALWVVQDTPGCEDGSATYPCTPRLRLRQSFPITFYAAGPNQRLHLLWQYLANTARAIPLTLSRQERRDLFQPEPVTVLAVEVHKPGQLPEVFHRAAAAFPDLTYYDADLLLTARHAAVYGTFPLAKLRLTIEGAKNGGGVTGGPAVVRSLQVLDSPWDLDAPPPPLRVMRLSLDCDPRRGKPAWLEVTVGAGLTGVGLGQLAQADLVHPEPPRNFHAPLRPAAAPATTRTCRLSLQPERALLIGLRALLWHYDPDLLLTAWGDTWLLPHLLDLSEKLGFPLPLNRGASGDAFGGASGDALGGANDVGAGLHSPDGPDQDDTDPPLQSCDDTPPILRRPERSYHAYGQVIYRGQQVLLSGRWHIDMFNAMMFHDYALDGILESARVSALPVQQAARLSPGTGISNMQIVTALRQGVMTPWRKQQAEIPKTALDLLHADQGGLVYQPIIGLHCDVAEIDFISMYPSIMARFNISPETTGVGGTAEVVTTFQADFAAASVAAGGTAEVVTAPQADVVATPAAPGSQAVWVPELNLWVDQSTPGLVPQTLQPLLEKRIALKQRMAELPRWDPRKQQYKARAAAHKWLLVTCFGYLGYKNARFGRIEAHQAVTAYSRECLLRAKEAAEDLGYTVLHMYVDGLWVKRDPPQVQGKREAMDLKAGYRRGGSACAGLCCSRGPDPPLPTSLSVQEVQPLLDEIASRTGLPVALEGIYRWVAFLPSRSDKRVPVANRYFGVFQDGSLKLRGLEARRGDTPPFIGKVQMGLLERLARSVPEPAGTACAVAETGGLGGVMQTGINDPGYNRCAVAETGRLDSAAQAGINDPGYNNFCFPYPDSPLQSHPAWPEILAYLRQELHRLRQRRVPLEELLVTQKLSRTLEQYRSPSPAAVAAAQLAAIGKSTRPGQSVRFLYLRGEHNKGEDVQAWDCPPAPPPERLEIERYTTLFIRACAAVLQPFGLSEEDLRLRLVR